MQYPATGNGVVRKHDDLNDWRLNPAAFQGALANLKSQARLAISFWQETFRPRIPLARSCLRPKIAYQIFNQRYFLAIVKRQLKKESVYFVRLIFRQYSRAFLHFHFHFPFPCGLCAPQGYQKRTTNTTKNKDKNHEDEERNDSQPAGSGREARLHEGRGPVSTTPCAFKRVETGESGCREKCVVDVIMVEQT